MLARPWLFASLPALFLGCATARLTPTADHHQHLFSPDLAAILATSNPAFRPITAREVIANLDSAGIRKAVLLGTAYLYGSPSRNFPDEYARVRAENDWDAAQAALYPDRLIAFCGFNPLKDYALDEIERCSKDPRLNRGIKLHFGNSDVQVDNPHHVARLAQIFRAANAHHMAMVIHMRASLSRKRPYGAQQARIFLEQLLPSAPDVVVQVAHLAGTGPGYDDPPADSAMAVLADAVQRGDPRTKNLWFDVTTVADAKTTPQQAALIAQRIRQVGVRRVLYGSDAAAAGNPKPRELWTAFRRIPLTENEFGQIAHNVAPYFTETLR
ncbi:MAG TPA: amidohydrolase family protein [Gemmatimonadaceae bacterium]|nr:amidohydrolase family protein [Gemmatimonadaceae bacterium]